MRNSPLHLLQVTNRSKEIDDTAQPEGHADQMQPITENGKEGARLSRSMTC